MLRYNVTGFVEELPQMPDNRKWHTCGALPATGVRFDQVTIATSGGNLLLSQLPSECDYLLRVLEFMAIILL